MSLGFDCGLNPVRGHCGNRPGENGLAHVTPHAGFRFNAEASVILAVWIYDQVNS